MFDRERFNAMVDENQLAQDEGFLALVIDGCVKGVAFQLNISPQRVHQIVAHDPYAAYMRIHRAMAAECPARAQQMADRFNLTHEMLMGFGLLPSMTTGDALGQATGEGVDVLKAELTGQPIGERKRETLEQIRALWAYYRSLEREEQVAAEVFA
ncbi:MAG: hypothetical protein LC731_03770 [Acidobacteria bacterium]|nr:hypothetical protein [Acidobacteriota bacterium]